MSSNKILLATLNSSYQHASFGLRYLYANLHEFQQQAQILEFTINQDIRIIAEKILESSPKILGLGVYIWNARQSLDLARIIKKVSPDTVIVLGGPEVSYDTENQTIAQIADFVVKGEGDFIFYELCRKILHQEPVENKIIKGVLPEISTIVSPYSYYTDEDIKNRVIYVEASRGCPYKCEYCLSSLDIGVRNFPIEPFLLDLEKLIQRGAKQFKFVDRTFNLSPKISGRILSFFLERIHFGLFLHFEMVPDRLPVELRELITQFPAGALQFEVGVQTWNPEVAKNVSRRQDYNKIRENFAYLNSFTQVHTHADLLVGLPGESLESFAQGFDALLECGPDEIQVGILKYLKGTPIARHNISFQMVYQDHPPFQILANKDMSYQEIQQMGRFSKFWDLIANSGNFPQFLSFFKERAAENQRSFFGQFMELTNFLTQRHPEGYGIALLKLLESLWLYLTEEIQLPSEEAREILIADYTGKVKRDIPGFLKTKELPLYENTSLKIKRQATPKRQLKHLQAKGLRPT